MDNRKERTKKLIGQIKLQGIAYSQNIGSQNARKILDKDEQICIEVWYDKHYDNRVEFGDKEGERKGIGEDVVQKLVLSSLGHLMYYSFRVKGFSFVSSKEYNVRSVRIVVQEDTTESLLNVAIGFYHIVDNKYEVTVYTAMVTDDFRVGDGQYVILIDDVNSSLKRMSNNKLLEVCSYP